MIFTFDILMFVLIAHFLCDFILQSDKMAVNKSKSWYWLTMHVTTYSFGMLVASFLLLGFRDTTIRWVAVNYVLHWITDAITSRISSYFWRVGKHHWFFVTIGFDQLIHYFCLFNTLGYFVLL